MDKIIKIIKEVFEKCPGNQISEDEAICTDVIGLKLYEQPIVAFGNAKDMLFEQCKEDAVVGPLHWLPYEWLPDAKTVIALFFPFSDKIKSDNRKMNTDPSLAWLHGRIEGQRYLNDYMKLLKSELESKGIKTCVPAIDPRFKAIVGKNHVYASNWSERHAAYICGLGTFGLSKGIITEKGMAGRVASIIIDLEIDPTVRKYSDVYEYCTKCGACITRCPVDAITFEHGKNHDICSDWLDEMGEKYKPRYGCGMCQTKVPCESGIPAKNEK